MITFFVALALLIGGYFVYGKIVERAFNPDDRLTPASTMEDGVDFVPMKTGRIFLIQLLNIAGLGPIFGALLGALWGPVVFLWIVFGTIFAGGVHDYLSGMISVRHNGASISEIVGMYLGNGMKTVMRIFSVVLLVLVGTVFMTGPAGLLARLTPDTLTTNFWLIVVLIYYFLATLLPIDKLIGKIYPVFGVALIVMALGIGGGILVQGYHIPELTLTNMHPDNLPIWPMMFITVACGAISGFHATQSPMMARCIKSEKDGRKVFYGAMVAEGIIALIWAAAGVAFYETTGGLSAALTEMGGQAGVVYDISFKLLGPMGGVLAMIGVIACPITSGDTAFRSARLTLADWMGKNQLPMKNRLILAVPLLAVGGLLSQIDFNIIWRYFSWSNQTLAMIALWAAAVYLYKSKAKYWIAAAPAAFMSAVSCTYILQAPEGFKLSTAISYPVGAIFAIVCLGIFLKTTVLRKKEESSLDA
ncbi:carbon starvation protein A [Niameybacter massiliensis]|uniref:Carbon starvation protein A n=1 Tax=Holtiella tumoricola TaxID=3018743 RepID=A0AA42DQ17_9FIRM|nr:carbon starvation protein A [Holtiella tumoricola]MDA3732942.1 carbon starvation protein A [Holtiella tumoricola]